jgi:glucose/arabinose dehydrogenase
MLRRVLPLAAVFSVAFSAFSAPVVIDGRRFSVAEGFTVERIATTNQVLRPVNACLDDRGRLYVTDASGSSQPPAEQAKDPRWRVLRLEDRDGDGQFEHSEIFADKLPMLQGILWHDGVVYVGGTPAIWKLLDKDGDGRADERIEWWNVGRPSTHCGNEVHGPYAGPDGFIYWTKGAFEPIQWTNGVSEKHIWTAARTSFEHAPMDQRWTAL